MTPIFETRSQTSARRSNSPIYEIFDVTFSRFSVFLRTKKFPERPKSAEKGGSRAQKALARSEGNHFI